MRRILIALAMVMSLSSAALSCSCAGSGICPGLGDKGQPLFVGTVLAVTDLPSTSESTFLSSRKARIRVDESFGGIPADVRELDVFTGSGGGDCGIRFQPGEVYLVAATVGDDGLAHAGLCSAT